MDVLSQHIVASIRGVVCLTCCLSGPELKDEAIQVVDVDISTQEYQQRTAKDLDEELEEEAEGDLTEEVEVPTLLTSQSRAITGSDLGKPGSTSEVHNEDSAATETTAVTEATAPEQEIVASQEADAGRGAHFRGAWVGKSEVPAGFEDVLQVSGVPYALRLAALARMKTFVPKVDIGFDGLHCVMVNVTPMGTDQVKDFVCGGPEFRTKFGPQNKPGSGLGSWEGDTLVLKIELDDGKKAELRFVAEGSVLKETLALEGTSGEQATMVRTYHK